MAYIFCFFRDSYLLLINVKKKTFLKTKAISVSSELNNNFKTVLSITSFINCIYNIISLKFWANILNNQSHIIEVSIAPVSFRQDKKMIEIGSNKNRSVYHVKATKQRYILRYGCGCGSGPFVHNISMWGCGPPLLSSEMSWWANWTPGQGERTMSLS